MKKYYIYRLNEKGIPKLKQTVRAENIDAVWLSNKGWYSEGIFIIASADGEGAKIFRLHRRDTQ